MGGLGSKMVGSETLLRSCLNVDRSCIGNIGDDRCLLAMIGNIGDDW